jgi:hypothetical protein
VVDYDQEGLKRVAKGGRNYQRTGADRGRPVSTATNIETWLLRALKKPGVTQVVLVYESLSGSEDVEHWALDELNEAPGETIFEAAHLHAEDLGAVGRYTIRLLGENGGALGAKHVRVQPEDDGDMPLGAAEVEDATGSGVVGQVMRHQEVMMRMYSGALGSVLGRMHDLLKMEQGENDRLRARLRVALKDHDEEDAISEAEAEERSAALGKLTDALTEHVIPALARRYGGEQH